MHFGEFGEDRIVVDEEKPRAFVQNKGPFAHRVSIRLAEAFQEVLDISAQF